MSDVSPTPPRPGSTGAAQPPVHSQPIPGRPGQIPSQPTGQPLSQPLAQPTGQPVGPVPGQFGPPPGFPPSPTGWVQGPNGWVRVPVYPPPAPLPPTVFQRYWPGPGKTAVAPRISISLIVVAAVVGAIGLVPTMPGFGWFVTAVALAALSVVTGIGRQPATAAGPVSTALAGSPESGSATVPVAPGVTDAGSTDLDGLGLINAGSTDGDSPDRDLLDSEPLDSEDAVVEVLVTETVATDAITAEAAAAQASEPASATAAGAAVGRTPVVLSFAEHGERAFWGACALALLAVGTFRAAGWLFFWCVVFALGSSAMALAGGRTVRALFASVWAPVMAPFRSPPWIARGLRRTSEDGSRILIASAVSVLLLLIFGGLFASADAEFRHVLGSILPPLKASEVARAILCFIIVGAVATGVAYLSAARPKFDGMAPAVPKLVRRAEWVLPLTVLNVLFAVFVFIQLTVLFGGDDKLANASHAYLRGYAHNGFWQLLVVSLLTLTVLLVTSRIAPRETPTDRRLLRILLGGLTVFSIVIVAAALKRVDTYEHLFGYTRLRVAVAGIELWFGLLFVLILIAGITLRASWLPRVVVASLVLSLLAGAIANPDLYVAQHNVDRYRSTGKLSISYMQQMSADALPAIQQLPANLQACALRDIAYKVETRGDDWRTWNFARVAARNALRQYEQPTAVCPDLVTQPSR